MVTINADGTYTLRNGGWNTVTTLDRIRTYAPVNRTLFSVKGEWFMRMEPARTIPRPPGWIASIPKPFLPAIPGPEPVKNDEGCVAGQLVTTEHVNELVEVWRKDMRTTTSLSRSSAMAHKPGGDYDKVKVKRSWNSSRLGR